MKLVGKVDGYVGKVIVIFKYFVWEMFMFLERGYGNFLVGGVV